MCRVHAGPAWPGSGRLDQDTVSNVFEPTISAKMERLVNTNSTLMYKRNWQIHAAFTRGEYSECMEVIEKQLKDTKGLCEYALYIKAMIKRQQGEIQESLQLFQAATCLNPTNIANLKQVARSLYLLGKHKAAIEVYEEAEKTADTGAKKDWEVQHNKGLCHTYRKSFDEAIACFKKANKLQRHDITFMQLGKVYTLQEDYDKAIEVYLDALEFSPENPEILTTLGLLYLRKGDNYKAFDYLGNSLTHDRTNPKTILAAGSIMQDHMDNATALIKYRISAQKTPNSAQLWNNIGMSFCKFFYSSFFRQNLTTSYLLITTLRYVFFWAGKIYCFHIVLETSNVLGPICMDYRVQFRIGSSKYRAICQRISLFFELYKFSKGNWGS